VVAVYGVQKQMVYDDELHVSVGNGYNGRYDESINIANYPTRIDLSSTNYSPYYSNILHKIGKYVIWFPGSRKVDGNPLGTEIGLPFVNDESNAPEDLYSQLKHIAIYQKVGELQTLRMDALDYYETILYNRTNNLHNKVSKSTLRQMIDCAAVIDLKEFTLKGRSSTADANDYGWTWLSAPGLAQNFTPAGVYPSQFYYTYDSVNSINRVSTKFPVTTDNDSVLPIKKYTAPTDVLPKFYSPNKSGSIYVYDAREKVVDLPDYNNNNKTYKLYKTNIIPGSSICGSNFVGDINYSYAITDD
jgi:hypothetical protein